MRERDGDEEKRSDEKTTKQESMGQANSETNEPQANQREERGRQGEADYRMELNKAGGRHKQGIENEKGSDDKSLRNQRG